MMRNSSVLGGVGRTQTLALHWHTHSGSMEGRTPCASEARKRQLGVRRTSLEMIPHKDRLPQRVVEFQATLPIIVYCDAEGNEFNIGLVAWDPLDPTRVHSAANECPPWFLQSACSMCPDVLDADDGLMNAVAMVEALALLIFPDMLRVCRILTYQDKSTVSIMQPPTLQRVAVRDVGAQLTLPLRL